MSFVSGRKIFWAGAAAACLFALLRFSRRAESPHPPSIALDAKTRAQPPAAENILAPDAPPEREYVRTLKIAEVPPPGAKPAPPADSTPQPRPPSPAGRFSAMPSGSGAPTAHVGVISARSRTAAPVRNPKIAAPPKRNAAGRPAPVGSSILDGAWSPEAARVLSAAQKLKTDAAVVHKRWDQTPMGAALVRQFQSNKKVDAGVRAALKKLGLSGRPATTRSMEAAAADVLAENDIEADEEDVRIALARASGPPLDSIPPEALAKAAEEILADPPTVEEKAKIRGALKQPKPGPKDFPPQKALDIYQRYRSDFDRVQEKYGVDPALIIATLGIETSYGANTGKYLVKDTARIQIEDNQDKTTPRAKRIVREAWKDITSVAELAATNDLGGVPPSQLRGSDGIAIGIPQFRPMSWQAYGVDADGGGRDPKNFHDAIQSIGNYYHLHGYADDIPLAIKRYNWDIEYVRGILKARESLKQNGVPDGPAPLAR